MSEVKEIATKESKETTRIEAFSDGVFAIAITLLILEIRVPPEHEVTSPGALWSSLAKLWPSYAAFAFSFVTLLVGWVNHHSVFNHIARASRPFMYANGFLLLTVTFLPFPTALLAEYITTDYAGVAIVVYCFTGVLSSIGWNILVETILKGDLLMDKPGNRATFIKYRRYVRAGFFIYALTALSAFWFPITALIINVSIWLLWVATSMIERLES